MLKGWFVIFVLEQLKGFYEEKSVAGLTVNLEEKEIKIFTKKV